MTTEWLPSVSVVVVMRNAAATIGEQLEALSRQDYAGPWEVVLADNGSTDDSVAVARQWEDRLPLRTSLRSMAPHPRSMGAGRASSRT